MTDLFDGEAPARPRHRRRRRRSGARLVGVLVVVLLLVALVGGGAYGVQRVLGHFESAPDFAGPGGGEVVVQVKDGDTATSVSAALVKAGVVKSQAAFLKIANPDPRAGQLQPGFYRLEKQMRAKDAFGRLFDPAFRVLGRVTIPEGYTVVQVLDALGKGTDIPLADYQAAAGNPGQLGLPDWAGGKLEGFLFPATYEVQPGATAADVLKQMVQRFRDAAQRNGLETRAAQLGITPYQALIVASLVEREGRVDDELPMISRVVYNRLDQKIPLGIDAAVLYGLGRTSGSLTQSDLAKNTPYENRRKAGLPPTPIANPGDKALSAALNPVEGTWLYYVLKSKDGTHLFTDDYQEFLRQAEQSRREGLF